MSYPLKVTEKMMKVMTRNSTAQTHNHKRPMALEMISTLPHKSHKEANVRKLTEKGQELHDEQRRKVAHRFSVSYEKWKAVIKDAKGALSGQCSNNLLNEHITKVSNASKNLNAVYEELRHIDILDHDTRRRVDTCTLAALNGHSRPLSLSMATAPAVHRV